ncbi:MAG: thiamine pyrophosphate-dependent dehydrogenase E1 component subunit alpha [Candidatus Omnitrophica bacterium]|nr:thiamine pyrophosphate-dependent dehydrogenase E1 component subunit alpha [Candidatus Omnitrophota bacterium]
MTPPAATDQPGLIEPTVLHRLHADMLRIRIVEERIAERYREQEMRCPVHLCVGQEAVPAGVCAALGTQDYVMSGHRSHGHYLAKGGSLPAMLAELYGKATGCSRGKGGSMHLVDVKAGFLGATPIVAATIPIAVGTALASALRGQSRVSAVFFGDAAPEAGAFHESLNFAALKRLPVLFVCENNFYSTASPLSVRQPAGREIVDTGCAHGVESHQADGNDAVAVYELARRAVEKARQGDGPTFLEFKTYRWREHCGPNDDVDLGYRTKAEVDAWKARCPIRRLEDRLLADGVLTPPDIEQLTRRIEAEFAEALAFAKASPFPEPQELSSHLYAP